MPVLVSSKGGKGTFSFSFFTWCLLVGSDTRERHGKRVRKDDASTGPPSCRKGLPVYLIINDFFFLSNFVGDLMAAATQHFFFPRLSSPFINEWRIWADRETKRLSWSLQGRRNAVNQPTSHFKKQKKNGGWTSGEGESWGSNWFTSKKCSNEDDANALVV